MGKCALCGDAFGRASMARHLSTCRAGGSEPVPASEKRPLAACFHIAIEGSYAKEYWMHVAAPVAAPLRKLDAFLRRTWLECCRHMSAFEIDGHRYASAPMDGESNMKAPLSNLFEVGTKFNYEYDYGSTTDLALKVVALCDRNSPKGAIQLLAVNEAPRIICQRCGKQAASLICTECASNGQGWFCAGCALAHDCGEEMCLPVVNSPRVGVCGYTG